jgi:glycerol-3-phosphate O-acyltransferase
MNRHSPLFRFDDARSELVDEACRRSYRDFLERTRRSSEGLEHLLNDAAYQEVERLEVEQGPETELRSRGWWMDISRRLGEMSDTEKRNLVRELVEGYTEDIAGHFDPRVYRLATQVLPVGLSLLFKAQELGSLPDRFLHLRDALDSLRDLSERVVLEGPLARLRKLSRRGTLVVVPTHSSNMDSILMGWSLYEAGLPPVTYGAGKNLFTNPLTSFFMNNLGAYKLDRRLQHDLYKHVLKTFSQVLLERGYHSLFFPGGTRSRSNQVEDHLKLGLLGTTIDAYVHNLLNHGSRRPLYIVPVTINYNLVLEAESLIDDHLQDTGGRRYFRETDEFDQVTTVVRFALNTMKMDSTTILRFGEPMDPFGNQVGPDGESYDAKGRRIDPTNLVRCPRSAEITADPERNRAYTRRTGRQVTRAFRTNTVIMPTQVVAFALFELLNHAHPTWDVYELLRLASDETIPQARLHRMIDRLTATLRQRADDGDFYLAPVVRQGSVGEIVEAGVDSLTSYHLPAAVERRGDGVRVRRLDLLYYYGNRVRTFDVDGAGLAASLD